MRGEWLLAPTKGENIWKEPTQQWEMERDKLGPRAIFRTSALSSTETASLYELIKSRLRYKTVWSRCCNTYNQNSHHLSKFVFWSLPCTTDMTNECYPSSNLVLIIQENNYWNSVISLYYLLEADTPYSYKKSPSPKKKKVVNDSHCDNWPQHWYQLLI